LSDVAEVRSNEFCLPPSDDPEDTEIAHLKIVNDYREFSPTPEIEIRNALSSREVTSCGTSLSITSI